MIDARSSLLIAPVQKIDTCLSAKFANMSFCCALLVVTAHIGTASRPENLETFVINTIGGELSGIAVPFFFLASGFFLAGHFNDEGWWLRELRKRVHSLLLPLVFWFSFGILWGAAFTALANVYAGRDITDSIPFCNGDFVPDIGTFWYLRTLFAYVLISPLFVAVIKKFSWCMVAILWIVYLWLYIFVLPSLTPEWYERVVFMFSPCGCAYFVTGIWLRQHDLRWICSRRFILVEILLLLLLMIGGAIIFQGSVLLYPFTMFVVFHLMPTERFPAWLVGTSFAIYILHPLVNVVGSIFVKHTIGNLGLVAFLAKWMIAGFGSILVANALKSFMPRFSKIVMGGR